MTYAAMLGGGLWYPQIYPRANGACVAAPPASTETAMAATADKVAMLGYAMIADRSTSKVLSAAGGGSIIWKTSTVTWANGGTTMDVGIQGVATGAGPLLQPDGSFGVKRTLTGGDGTVTSSAIKTTTMTGGSGTSTITHGSLVAVVWDMTARAGADSVLINGTGTGGLTPGGTVPLQNYFTAAAWKTSGARGPNVNIISDDGTYIGLQDAIGSSLANSVEAFADATNPDERGQLFQIPWDCKVDGVWAMVGCTDANSDFTITLYSDPLGTPASAGSVAVLAEQGMTAAQDRYRFFPFAAEVELTANTNYAVAVRATGSSNVRLPNLTLFSAAARVLNQGGTTVSKVTRDGGSGAFTAEATPTTMYDMGVRISSLNVSSSATPPKVYTA